MSGSLASAAQPGSPIYVVDSWPVLEFLYRQEPTRSRFIARLEAAERGDLRLLISRINFGEIYYNFAINQRRGKIPGILFDISDFPWQIASVDDLLVDQAAELKARYPISYADAFVAALARRHNAPVLTGDPDFQKLNAAGVVQLDWLGA
jgi:ribonuclease VapC